MSYRPPFMSRRTLALVAAILALPGLGRTEPNNRSRLT